MSASGHGWASGQTVANSATGSRDKAVEEPQAIADRGQRAELEGIPLFEADSLMEIGGLAIVQEIVDLTIETMGPQIRELEAAIEAEDWPQVKRLSHRLKREPGAVVRPNEHQPWRPGWKIRARRQTESKRCMRNW